MYCNKCGKQANEGESFCTKCGAKVNINSGNKCNDSNNNFSNNHNNNNSNIKGARNKNSGNSNSNKPNGLKPQKGINFKNKKAIIAAGLAIFLVCAGVFGFAMWQDDGVSVKENVVIFSENEMVSVKIEDEKITIEKDNDIKEGEVLVFPISDETPNGGLYKAKIVEEKNGNTVITTEPATLGDVFNEATFSEKFVLTESGELVVDENDRDDSNSFSMDKIIPTVYGNDNIPNDLNDFRYTFDLGEKINVPKEVATIQAGIDVRVEVDFEVRNWGKEVESSVKVIVEAGALSRLEDRLKLEKEINLLKQKLNPKQFLVGPVPVVITNEISLDATVDASVEDLPYAELYFGLKKEMGYDYNNTTAPSIKTINEDSVIFEENFEANEFKTNANLQVKIEANVESLLYGSTGFRGSADMTGYLEGGFENDELFARAKINSGLAATLVVHVPVIDITLLEKTLWESERFHLFPEDGEWYYLIEPGEVEVESPKPLGNPANYFGMTAREIKDEFGELEYTGYNAGGDYYSAENTEMVFIFQSGDNREGLVEGEIYNGNIFLADDSECLGLGATVDKFFDIDQSGVSVDELARLMDADVSGPFDGEWGSSYTLMTEEYRVLLLEMSLNDEGLILPDTMLEFIRLAE